MEENMPRRIRRNNNQSTVIDAAPKLKTTQNLPRSSSCNYLGRGVASLTTLAAFKYAGYKAAVSAFHKEFCLSQYIPFWMQNFFNADDSYEVKTRKFIASLFVSPDNRFSNAILNTVVLSPIMEDTKRIAYHFMIKKIQKEVALRFFGSKDFADTKLGIVMRIALAAGLAGMDHYQSPLSYEHRNHPEYLMNPIKRQMIDEYFWDERVKKDASLVSALVSALGYSIIYEANNSLAGVMLCHSLSNFVMIVTGISKY